MKPICVALDKLDHLENLELARQVSDHVDYFKVGLTSATGSGRGFFTDLSAIRPLFIDLKFHDIPAQVESAVVAVDRLGAELTTVHASGGADMIKAAKASASPGLRIIAVTVLTSFDDLTLETIGLSGPATDAVLRLAELALGAGADGLVCSALEVAVIRERFGAEPFLVVPGIRPKGAAADDQRRTLGPREALEAGADLLVVGRPITSAPDPTKAARDLAESLS